MDNLSIGRDTILIGGVYLTDIFRIYAQDKDAYIFLWKYFFNEEIFDTILLKEMCLY